MDIINIFSLYSQKEILGKKGTKEGLYKLFESVFDNLIIIKKNKYLYSINGKEFHILKLRTKEKLLDLLNKRKTNPPEITEWKGRFEREEIFYSKNILGKKYELYSGGIDSQIWGLSILFDVIMESEKESEILIFYSKRRSGFKKIKAKKRLIQLIRKKSF